MSGRVAVVHPLEHDGRIAIVVAPQGDIAVDGGDAIRCRRTKLINDIAIGVDDVDRAQHPSGRSTEIESSASGAIGYTPTFCGVEPIWVITVKLVETVPPRFFMMTL